MGLRLIDSIIIPLNTTQYALELDQYLDTSVVQFLVDVFGTDTFIASKAWLYKKLPRRLTSGFSDWPSVRCKLRVRLWTKKRKMQRRRVKMMSSRCQFHTHHNLATRHLKTSLGSYLRSHHHHLGVPFVVAGVHSTHGFPTGSRAYLVFLLLN